MYIRFAKVCKKHTSKKRHCGRVAEGSRIVRVILMMLMVITTIKITGRVMIVATSKTTGITRP